MVEGPLLEREREVERSRAKLTQDLAVLCSPDTFASFTDDLKQEALDTKDAFWQELKARAAANPAAVIAIGAGVAWRVVQRPPIATALIGVGLYSLWQTDAKPSTGDISYTQQSLQALKEQAGEFVSAAADIADHAQEAVSAKVSEALDATKDKIPGWADNVGGALGSASASVKSGSKAVRRTQHDLRDQMQYVASVAIEKVRDEGTRNKLLLGVAGVAITVALGIACQKRISEMLEEE